MKLLYLMPTKYKIFLGKGELSPYNLTRGPAPEPPQTLRSQTVLTTIQNEMTPHNISPVNIYTVFQFVNQISIILLRCYVLYSDICGVGEGVITFLYIPKGGHHFFSFNKGGGVMCFCEVFCW